jgi:protein involved in polysaccharide export with SLBB domain
MSRPCQTGRYLLAAALLAMAGCEVDSYFDPSKIGRFEYTPTTIPILDRIDVIERDRDPWAQATSVEPDDLLPGDLTYRLSPGDLITVEIPELVVQGELWLSTRRIDAAGYFRLPSPIGDVRAAGLTTQEFQDEVARTVDERVMRAPMVNVVVEEGAGFNYTIYGAITGTGVYTLRSADFRLLDALALAGGVPLVTERIYVIRQVSLTPEIPFEPARRAPEAVPTPGREPPADIEDLIRQLEEPETEAAPEPQVDIEDLIRELEEPIAPPSQEPPIDIEDVLDELDEPPPTAPQKPPVDIEDLIEDLDEEQAPGGRVAPGAFFQESGPPIDIDELEPLDVPSPPPVRDRRVDVRPPEPVLPLPAGEQTYIYVQERDEWVPVRADTRAEPGPEAPPAPEPEEELIVERIIEIPFQRLKQGDSSYNIVIRPMDRIYVQEPQSGVIYIDGEISRPGVYSLPVSGRLTLSRLVAAAGGPGPLAIPERVDLTRIVGENREATIRLNLGAIREKTEPDLYLKPDDHVIIGTSFWATPLAVFRNGLRMTYGFGFLLDRNFGNDVFGPPPTDRGF